MTSHEIVPATMEHIDELSRTMRPADREEVIAQSGMHPALALGVSFGNSDAAWAGLIDGKVACVWGVGVVDVMSDEVGAPWMLGSELIVEHQRLFLRHCLDCVEKMQDMFPVLENHVDARNHVAIKWLRWLGFVIMPTEPHGPYSIPFHRFRRVREQYVY